MTKTIKKIDRLFLKNAKIEDFRTIRNIDVYFGPGLNIIIGKNGSGKTNFLHSLSRALELSDKYSPYSAHLILEGDATFEIIYKGLKKDINFIKQTKLNHKLSDKLNEVELRLNNKKIKIEESIFTTLDKKNISYSSIFIQHGTPKNDQPLITSPLSFSIAEDGLSNEIFHFLYEGKVNHFLKTILTRLFIETNLTDIENRSESNLNSIIGSFNKHFINLSDILNRFSPIQEIRFNNNYNVFKKGEQEELIVDNLFIEFKINNTWLPFSQLSDGTKRIFYIISEIHSIGSFYYSRGRTYSSLSQPSIILLEEPELGVHPHQLHKLMLFIREQAESKQIILTTHAPQILDFIEEGELDKIIISRYNIETGSQFLHLTDREKEKAALYMEDEHLSDYWKHSTLEE
ncbi:hypothetical protein EFA69_08315 [Rufibacter immobilis]|uniref:ATPase AAA-type core domain-containing protein n=1 Tax=Rufibacter immobilis TaxID=1348778 RepID=A0A3M9MVJ6_9BACT|nr:ATP-binding protein [Rufibacter immobilis]RNI29551.1 hypothetical protein EFA69_08315 [Rufibacter immobilis]